MIILLVNCANERLREAADKSSEAGRKVYEAYIVIPNTAVKISGEVIVSAKEFIFAFTNVSRLHNGAFCDLREWL